MLFCLKMFGIQLFTYIVLGSKYDFSYSRGIFCLLGVGKVRYEVYSFGVIFILVLLVIIT